MSENNKRLNKCIEALRDQEMSVIIVDLDK